MKPRLPLHLASACLLLLLSAARLPAQHGGAAHQRMADSVELGASAVFDARGTLWAVHSLHRFIVVSRSDNDGAAWSNPVLVSSQPEPLDPGADARPKIALGPRGEIYLTWTRPLSKPFTGEIRFSRSLDGGRTFSEPVTIHRDRQEITHRFDALAVDGGGKIYVAWIDKRDLVAATAAGRPYAGAAVYFAVSDDRGATFRGDFKVADHSCECCRMAIVARPEGGAVVMWRHVIGGGIRDHALAELRADGSVAALRRATYEGWKLDGCPHHGPGLALTKTGDLRAVWFSGAPEARGIFLGEPGRGPGTARRQVGADRAMHADLAIAGGRMAVAWYAPEDGRYVLYAATAALDGSDWREQRLTAHAGMVGHPQLLVKDGRFFVFWNTAAGPRGIWSVPTK